MNREIKFRAWDKIKKEFTLNDSFYELQKWNRTEDELKDFEIMQYTNLKDKNGVEIFENDLIKHNNYGQISVVEWSDGDWGWYMKSVKHWNPKTHFDSSVDEVIGNIYENSDLLK
jgi:uncharacterized phage protein (TIGR01671 family)